MTDAEKRMIAQLQQVTGLTGGAYVIIRDGKVERTECFGMADKEAGRPVTENSFFDIASNSKAFTSMLGAIATDESVFDWDAPIRTYMPEFNMVDEYVAAHITGRDLASHRTGLGRHEFMRAKVAGTIEDMVLRTAYMEMANGFRDKYEYNNHMFIVLGYILERAYGRPYAELIREKITDPLGMTVRFRARNWDNAGLDCALPYRTDGHGGAHRCEYASNPVSAACGGVKTNIAGMSRWLTALCNGGQGLCSEKAFSEFYKTNVAYNENTSGAELCNGYSLGWRTSAYRGRFLVSHGGSINGFGSQVGFFPDRKEGFAILTNTGSAWGAAILREVLLDELCDAVQPDYTRFVDEWRDNINGLSETLIDYRAGRALTADEIAFYTGSFYHPSYDEFTISEKNGEALLEYGNFSAAVRMCKDGTALACEDDAAPEYLRMWRDGNDLIINNSDCALKLKFKRL